ncbi:MAG: hypothetical protein ACR2HF_10760 [Methylococcaceae bacterium]
MMIQDLRKTTAAPARRSNNHPVEYDAQPAQSVAQLPKVGVGLMDLQSFELIQRAAKLLASSTLVPKEYQGQQGLPNCVIALNMASRMNADPLMVMQNLYLVHGRPSWSAQFLIATFNQCGRFSAIRYEWTGKKGEKGWGCKAFATEKETGDRIESAAITWELVQAEGWDKRNGSKWQTMPEQMFMYRSAAWLVRAYAPELSMGLHTADENSDRIYEAEAREDGSYAVPSPEPEPEPEQFNASEKMDENAEKQTVDTQTGEIFGLEKTAEEIVDSIKSRIQAATSTNEVDEILDSTRSLSGLTRIMKNGLVKLASEKAATF